MGKGILAAIPGVIMAGILMAGATQADPAGLTPPTLTAPTFTAPAITTHTFTAHWGAIYRPDGTPFVARGINLQYGDNPVRALPALAAIASTGANIVRLELRRNTSADDLRAALDEAVRLKLPIMLMYWEGDITCGHDAAILRRDVHDLWLTRWAAVLSDPRYQPYMMINIANEWGSSAGDFGDYLATYTDLIHDLRAGGIAVPIVVDAADCGQATETFLDGRGQALVAADPLHDVIVSVHAYNRPWNAPDRIDRHVADLKATGVPFLIGEFGDRDLLEDGNNSVDHLHLMAMARAQDIGWIAWSWKGNGGATHVLDMSRSYGAVDLSRRGNDVVNGPDGIKASQP